MQIETLKSLQVRVRQTTAADRELDAEIFAAFNKGTVFKDYCDVPGGYICRVRIGRRVVSDFPAYTTDPEGLAPCVLLMREQLPGCEWVRTATGEFAIWCYEGATIGWLFEADKSLANDCITFLDAIFSALIEDHKIARGALTLSQIGETP